MDPRKIVFQETAIVAVGEVICTAAMIGIFFLMGYFNTGVVLGAIVGMVLAIGNFLFMAIGASLAADKAEAQDVKGGQATVQMFYIGRLIGIAVILFALIKSGLCNVYTAVIPLIFTRPILTIYEFFRKGDQT